MTTLLFAASRALEARISANEAAAKQAHEVHLDVLTEYAFQAINAMLATAPEGTWDEPPGYEVEWYPPDLSRQITVRIDDYDEDSNDNEAIYLAVAFDDEWTPAIRLLGWAMHRDHHKHGKWVNVGPAITDLADLGERLSHIGTEYPALTGEMVYLNPAHAAALKEEMP